MKNGIMRMQRASLTCDIDVSNVALLAANEFATNGSALALKLVMNGPAYPLVTCSDIPSRAEKMKNRAMRFVLKSLNASRPNRCDIV